MTWTDELNDMLYYWAREFSRKKWVVSLASNYEPIKSKVVYHQSPLDYSIIIMRDYLEQKGNSK